MRLTNILNNKFVAVIAGIFSVGFLLAPANILFFSAWLLGAVFTWKKEIWASALLTVLAIYSLIADVLDEVLDIRGFREYVHQTAIDMEMSESFVLGMAVAALALETVILLCVIYYSVTVVTRNRKIAGQHFRCNSRTQMYLTRSQLD
ncbi:MAG: hypothetical protein ACYS8Z_14255 [Planctomycetota bacterium]|jgi:hypothetical protein